MQAIVECGGIFIDVNIGWPGKVHDARVFTNSSCYRKSSNGTLFLDWWSERTIGHTRRSSIPSTAVVNSLRALLRMRGNRPPRGINFITRGEMAAVSTCVLAVGERLYYSRWKRLVFATTGRDRQCYVTIII